MYTVYLLKSASKPNKSYVGLTIKPTEKRLSEHNKGESQYTKAYIPWQLIYFERFYCITCAEKREKFLKSGVVYRLRRVILENFNRL